MLTFVIPVLATVGLAYVLKLGMNDSARRFEPRLMRPVGNVGDLPKAGRSMVIVADVRGALHFRIIEGDSRKVVDTDETRLTSQAGPIADLKKRLENLWPPHQLGDDEKEQVITAVTSLVDHTLSARSVGLLDRYFQFQRTVHFSSSVSPSSATLLLGASMLCWPLWQLRRLRLNSLFRVECPFAPKAADLRPGLLTRLGAIHEDMVNTVTHPYSTTFRHPLAPAIAAAFLVFLYQIAYRFIPPVEGPVFAVTAAATLLAGPFLFLFVLLHTYRLVGQYRELLRQLALLPMADAYERLPLKVSFTFGRFLSNFTPRVSNLALAVQQYKSLLEYPATHKEPDGTPANQLRQAITNAYWAVRAEHVCDSFQAEIKLEDNPLQLTQPEYAGGFDLRLMSWGDGTRVPTSWSDLVVVGIDNSNLLHIRIFDASGNRVTDTDETELPAAQAAAVAALKQQIPGLLSPHVLTDTEKAQVISEATSIVGQTHAGYFNCTFRNFLHLSR
jgi:hypothetical protein